jgi:hypothetical protein
MVAVVFEAQTPRPLRGAARASSRRCAGPIRAFIQAAAGMASASHSTGARTTVRSGIRISRPGEGSSACSPRVALPAGEQVACSASEARKPSPKRDTDFPAASSCSKPADGVP